MKMLKLYPLIFLILSSVAVAKVVENYSYPYANPYMATLTYGIVQIEKNSPARQVVIPGMANRAKVSLLEGRNSTIVNVYKRKGMAPMAFMLTGTGSQSTDAGVNSQAEQLYKLGYSVVVFPSPMSWNFILAENQSTVLGYTPDEARLLYDYMQKVMGIINADHSYQISDYVLVGYSLGAGEAAFISELDRKEKVYNFSKILLVNPPLDLLYSISTLDQLLYVAAKWTPATIDYVEGLIYSYAADLLARNYQDPNYYVGLDQSPFGNTFYDKFLIGAAFRSTLGDDIFTIEQINDTGLLKTPASKGRQSDREAEAHSISFADFAQKFVVPSLAKEHRLNPNIHSIFDAASMNSLKTQLAANPKIFIWHNADDVLVKPQDIEAFEAVMGDRMTIFPHGGHLGNVWYSDNIKMFRKFFKRN